MIVYQFVLKSTARPEMHLAAEVQLIPGVSVLLVPGVAVLISGGIFRAARVWSKHTRRHHRLHNRA